LVKLAEFFFLWILQITIFTAVFIILYSSPSSDDEVVRGFETPFDSVMTVI